MKKLLVCMTLIMLLTLNGCSDSNGASNDTETTPSITVTSGDSKEDVVSEVEATEEEASEDSLDSTVESHEVTESKSPLKTEAGKDRESTTVVDLHQDQRVNNQAGLLTAGEWNDNKNYDYFTQVLNDNYWYSMTSYWNFVNWDRYEFEIVNEDNQPIVNAKIELHSDQTTYYTVYTDNKGYAVVYPHQDKVFIQQQKYDARVTYNQNSYEIITLDDQYYKITLDEKSEAVDKVDLMLMIDTTGSMDDELSYLKTELSDVVSRVMKNNANHLDINVSSNYYRDHGDQYLLKSYPFTSNINEVVSQINEQEANGGGDFEEAVVEALNDAIYNHEWRSDAQAKLLFLVLDAPPHHTDQNIEQIHNLIKKANELGIRIIPVASSGIDKETEFLLRFLGISTNGTYVFLTDHSGVGGAHMTPTIGYYQVEQLNDLMVRLINSYIK